MMGFAHTPLGFARNEEINKDKYWIIMLNYSGICIVLCINHNIYISYLPKSSREMI